MIFLEGHLVLHLPIGQVLGSLSLSFLFSPYSRLLGLFPVYVKVTGTTSPVHSTLVYL